MEKRHRSAGIEDVQLKLAELMVKIAHLPASQQDLILSDLLGLTSRFDYLLQTLASSEHSLPAQPDLPPPPAVFADGQLLYHWDLESAQMQNLGPFQNLLGIEVGPHPQHRDWWVQNIHPDDRAGLSQALTEIVEGEQLQFLLEYRVYHSSGRWLPVKDQGVVTRDEAGRARCVAGAISPVVEAQAGDDRLVELSNQALGIANQALRASEQRFQVAIANAPLAVFSTGLDLRYNWFYSPFMGPIAASVVGRLDDEILRPEDAEKVLSMKRAALASGSTVTDELELTFPNGARRLMFSIAPLRDQDGQTIGLVGAAMDVTEQQALKERQAQYVSEVEMQRSLLEHRELERQQLARELHDGPIQNLSGVIFSLQIAAEMSEEPDLTKALYQLREDAKALSQELREVCNQLRPPALTKFGLLRAIQALAEEFSSRSPQVNIELELIGSDADLPEGTALALYRICQESLNNALHHAEAQRIAVLLIIDTERIDLSIADNGKGFDLRADWVELVRQGHFGLAGMKERAEAIGGRLEVISRPGGGTRVAVHAPRRPKKSV